MTEKQSGGFFGGLLVGILVATVVFSVVRMKDRQGGGETTEAVTLLKLAHGLDTKHPVHAAMEHMKERLEALSGGAMSLEIYPSGMLGNETECIELLQNAQLAMTKTSASPMEAFVPTMAVFSLPYVFRDADHFWTVLDGPIGQELLVAGETKNIRGLCYYDAGSRNFYSTKKPILTPADLKGMKIRVMSSKTAMDMIKAMGGSPTPIPWGELYTALQQGVVDGAENNPPSYYTNRHLEVCPYFSMNAHTRVPDILVMSTKIWAGLSDQQQAWVQQAADESSKFQRDLWKRETVKVLEQAVAEGVEVSYPDLKPFADAVAPMLASYDGTPVGDLLRQMQEVK